MAIEYRQAKPTDLQLLTPLVEAYAREQEQQMPINTLTENFIDFARSGLAQAIQHPAAVVMVAEETGGETPIAVGYAVGIAQEPPAIFESELYTFLSDLFVVPEFRRQGVATALVERVRGWGWVKGINRMSLVLPTTSPAMGLYQKVGFKPIQTMLYLKDE
ncbi:MAG TPA: GNAT family N-acetyltransferase [Symbiobacteriaceae bacterium]|jgi:GNAT superfamily N-acetyltransferase|nr:GNAT family N-acetyltransferase [Symbiobacteriaceae bacterium]